MNHSNLDPPKFTHYLGGSFFQDIEPDEIYIPSDGSENFFDVRLDPRGCPHAIWTLGAGSGCRCAPLKKMDVKNGQSMAIFRDFF